MSSRSQFSSRLSDAGRLHIDASVLALHLLGHPKYVELTRILFASLRAGECTAQTSVISLYQVAVEPYRRGRTSLAMKVHSYLAAVPGLEIVPVSSAIAAQAAQVRAQLGGRTERALQIATALFGDVEAFVTHRSGLRRIAGMTILSLDSHVASSTSAAEPERANA